MQAQAHVFRLWNLLLEADVKAWRVDRRRSGEDRTENLLVASQECRDN